MNKKIKRKLFVIWRVFTLPFYIFKPKIFCISFQRTGTTSVGVFFHENNYRVATYAIARKNDWTLKWFKGDYESIFNSLDFKSSQVFEDDPWWCQDFYKILYHRFPRSKFILFERDADKWFDSMISHSGGKSLGNTYRHSRIYRRENEFYKLGLKTLYSREIDNLLPLTEAERTHYTSLYILRNKEIKEFFKEHDNKRLFCCRLEDPDKWQKLGRYLNLKISSDYQVHANRSKSK